jgi:hypothetical protein
MYLDADLPDFRISEYSPIDEFFYTLPAFNLLHYVTWTHQLAPWAPVEGWPMNIVQNVVAALTMFFGGYSYWGLRASSVLFALVGFVAIWRLIRSAAQSAVLEGATLARSALVIEGLAVALLLVDFGSLVAARGIEPTVSRFAVIGLLIWSVHRGWLLQPNQGIARSVAFGLIASIAVWFVYIYNLFLLPAVAVALVVCVHRRGSIRRTIAHIAGFMLGAALGTAGYFGIVAVLYNETPLDWYRVWIGAYSNSSRVEGFSFANLASMLDANSFRFDAPLLLLFLLGIPVFVWWTARARRPWAVLILAMLGCFALQSAAVADYPYKKFLILIIFALPIVATGLLRFGQFLRWLRADRRAFVLALIYAAIVVAVWAKHYFIGFRIPADPRTTSLVQIAAGLVIAGGMAYALGPRRFRPALVLGLAVTSLVPMAYLDWHQIYGHPTFTYRDSLVAAGRVIDGETTAGDYSLAMQLYNTSTPVLPGYVYGLTNQQYLADVVRAFRERRASWLFADAGSVGRTRWEPRGFVLVETYPIKLPNGEKLGRYAFTSGGAPP